MPGTAQGMGIPWWTMFFATIPEWGGTGKKGSKEIYKMISSQKDSICMKQNWVTTFGKMVSKAIGELSAWCLNWDRKTRNGWADHAKTPEECQLDPGKRKDKFYVRGGVCRKGRNGGEHIPSRSTDSKHEMWLHRPRERSVQDYLGLDGRCASYSLFV